MAVLSTTLRQEYEAQVKRCFPEAKLGHCETEDDFQQVIELHLDKGLCAPGVLTKEKVKSYAEVVRYFYPRNFLKAKISDIWSIFTQVIFVEAAYRSIEAPHRATFLRLGGTCNPILIYGRVDPDLEGIGLGVQKKDQGEENWIFLISDSEMILREKLSYIIDQKNVPPTFIIEDAGKKSSFQLFYRDSTTLFQIHSHVGELSFPRFYVRELAFSEIRRLNLDPSFANIMIDNEKNTLKFIDGSYAFPKKALPHKISTLFSSDVFKQHLPGPFSDAELAYLNTINVAETCALLESHRLEEESIQTYRCVLFMLKCVIPFNADSTNPITLEDLLVIVNLSDRRGFSFKETVSSYNGALYTEMTHYLYGSKTLFSRILEAKNKSDGEICQKVDEVFSMLVNLKSSGCPRPGTPNRGTVHDYYHKSKKIYSIN